jgi:hypothetical protein
VETRITGKDLDKVSRCWVAVKNGGDIFFEVSKHDLSPNWVQRDQQLA